MSNSTIKTVSPTEPCEPCKGKGEVECPHGCAKDQRDFANGDLCGNHLQDMLCHTCLHDEDRTEEAGFVNCWNCDGEGVTESEEFEEGAKLLRETRKLFEEGAKLQASGLTLEAEAFLQFIGA